MSAKPKTKPKPHPTGAKREPLRFARPDHERLVIKFCGGYYPYVEPPRIKADVLRGHVLMALAKMQPHVQAKVWQNAERIAASEDKTKEAAIIEAGMSDSEKIALKAGSLLATADMFEAVALACNLDHIARTVAENSYKHAELEAAFWLIAGAIMLPFGGTPSGSGSTSRTKTASTSTETGTL
jgi:hypothetical protein